jgi:hypothetical protein
VNSILSLMGFILLVLMVLGCNRLYNRRERMCNLKMYGTMLISVK